MATFVITGDLGTGSKRVTNGIDAKRDCGILRKKWGLSLRDYPFVCWVKKG